MDETLIHCVDDFETDDPDAIVKIMFPDEEEPVCVKRFTLILFRLALILDPFSFSRSRK